VYVNTNLLWSSYIDVEIASIAVIRNGNDPRHRLGLQSLCLLQFIQQI